MNLSSRIVKNLFLMFDSKGRGGEFVWHFVPVLHIHRILFKELQSSKNVTIPKPNFI